MPCTQLGIYAALCKIKPAGAGLGLGEILLLKQFKVTTQMPLVQLQQGSNMEVKLGKGKICNSITSLDSSAGK